jgi:hypothetical protein
MSGDEGFFSRWSRRKAQRRAGESPPTEPTRDAPRPQAVESAAPIDAPPVAAQPVSAAPRVDGDAQGSPVSPLPTLADVAQLTPTSDFSRFVATGVEPSVQHAALKTLFSDPHFNVMDGLDVYIDDYNTPNPIPDAMRRRLQAHAARRILDAPEPANDETAADATAVRADSAGATAASPDGASAPALPQSPAPGDTAFGRPGAESDEDTALRLQPDDAADATGMGADRPGARA